MTILHIIFSPILYLWKDDNFSEVEFPLAGKYQQLNTMIISNLIKDVTNIKNILSDVKSLHYEYNQNENLIHLYVITEQPITVELITGILYNYNPDNRGPDTWMLQDIFIVSDDIANKFGLDMIEMVPKLLKIFIVNSNDYEDEINLDWI
jgi:hypothetical protein